MKKSVGEEAARHLAGSSKYNVGEENARRRRESEAIQ